MEIKNLGSKIKKVLPYSIYGCIVFVIFLYLTFPIDRLKPKIVKVIEKNINMNLEVESIDKHYITGFELENFKLLEKVKIGQEPETFLTDKSFSVWLNPIPLIWGNKNISFAIKGRLGKLEGKISISGKESSIDLNSSKLNFSKLDFLAKKYKLAGKGSLTLDADINTSIKDYSKASGKIVIKGKKIKLSNLEISTYLGPLVIPPTNLSDINIYLTIKNGAIDFRECLINGDLYLKGTGNIKLAKKTNYSKLDLLLKIKVSGEIEKKFGLFLSQFFKLDPRDNMYTSKVQGTLGSPMFSPAL